MTGEISSGGRRLRVVGKILGILLSLVGLAFFALLARLKLGGELAGDLKVSLFLFGMGVLLLWIGCTSLFGSTRSSIIPDRGLSKLWVPAALAAAISCLLAMAHAIEIGLGARWLPDGLVWALLTIPVIIGLLLPGILARQSSQSDPPRQFVPDHWPKVVQSGVKLILTIGKFGYVAGLWLVWGRSEVLRPPEWEGLMQIVAFTMIGVLCASQALALHLSRSRLIRSDR